MRVNLIAKLFALVGFFVVANAANAGSCQKPPRFDSWGTLGDNFHKAKDFCDADDSKFDIDECDRCCDFFKHVAMEKPKECKILKNPPKEKKTVVVAPVTVSATKNVAMAENIKSDEEKVVKEEEAKRAEEEKQQEEMQKQEIETMQEVDKIKTEKTNLFKTQGDVVDVMESRGKLKKFFIGPDYKNIGQLRSELSKNVAQMGKLQNALVKTVSEENKEIIRGQLRELRLQQEKINTVISTNESTFSLFGWFAKIFS